MPGNIQETSKLISPIQGNMSGNIKGTAGLKALAAMYLLGNIRGNNKETCSLQKKEPAQIKIEKFEFRGAAEIITSGGESLWVVTEKEALKYLPSGAVYFTAKEIEHLDKTDSKTAEAALRVKQAFGDDVRVRGVKELSEGKIRARLIDLFPIGGKMVQARLYNGEITVLWPDSFTDAERELGEQILRDYPLSMSDFE